MDDALIAGAAAIAGAAGAMTYAVRGRSATLLAPSIYHGDRKRPSIALTFDDGPSESTPLLLELLAKHNARATFFMCGTNVRRCPTIAREVVAQGHEIGNHTDSHPAFYFKPSEFIYREIALAQETIQRTLRITPKLFRAPYGIRWFGMRRAQERLQLTGVMWTTIARDWKLPAPEIAARLLKNAKNGAIFCLHDGRAIERSPDIRETLRAVEQILPALEQQGFAFETVSQLCNLAK